MERPQDLKPTTATSSKAGQITLVIIIILFHFVGMIGLSIPSLRPIFLKIVPWHLLLMLVVICISHRPFDGRFMLFLLVVFIAGFFAEWIGVHKYWLFGNYSYGSTLGFKFDGTPLTIGVNWFLLVYSAGVIMQRSRVKSMFIRVIIGALLLVLLDMLIEPVAIKFDYWYWAGNIIQVKNYVCWFLVSGVMLFVFERFKFEKQCIVAPVFLVTEFLFFGILCLL